MMAIKTADATEIKCSRMREIADVLQNMTTLTRWDTH